MTSMSDAVAPPLVSEVIDADGGRLIRVSGAWNLRALAPRYAEMDRLLRTIREPAAARWDLHGVTELDHAGAALLGRTWAGRRLPRVESRAEHEPLFRRLRLVEQGHEVPKRERYGWWLLPGVWSLHVMGHLRDFAVLLGFLALDLARLIANPSRGPWREISANLYRTGAQALAITAMVGFLIGVVLSFLSSNQLKLFGADVFIVNILGVSILRELGPVLAAILVAGRSGSSMTAQLGVMRVTQELDAMSVMGIPQMYRLVLPKVIALAIGLPLLVVWTNAVALLGGMVAASNELGLGYLFFLDTLPKVVPIANLYLGVGKGAVFGVLIALIACHYGLRIRPNTESLGAGTTSSVVSAITMVILVDAVFAVMFRGVGLGF